MEKVKRIEISYGLKRPIVKFASEYVAVTLTKEVDVADEKELTRAVHTTFSQARQFVENEVWCSQQSSLKRRLASDN